MKIRKNLLLVILAGIYFFGFFLWSALKPADEYSYSERRKLAGQPKLSVETVLDGSFTEDFDTYCADQFPLRETFRRVYAYVTLYGLGRCDINGIYFHNGYAAKLETEIHQDSVDWALNRIQTIIDSYVTDNRVFFAIIPEKNDYLYSKKEYPYLGYKEFKKAFEEGLDERVETINLVPAMSLSKYYKTDSHWRQERLPEILGALTEVMGVEFEDTYEINTVETPFYGVYYGQSALPLEPDEMNYLTNDTIDQLIVNCYDTGKAVEMPVYDLEKTTGRDPYEMFLGGSKALITIENPTADNDKQLILFRDSFGSSIAPLLATSYSKVTLVDIRYISPAMLGRVVDFEDADILFLYSVSVLNNCTSQFIK